MAVYFLPFEQLPMVQKIINSVEKASKGVTPVQLILNNSISLSKQILMSKTRPTGQIDLSGRMDEWISRQNVLIKVAREKQSKTDHHVLVEYDPAVTTEYPINSSHFLSVEVISYLPDIQEFG